MLPLVLALSSLAFARGPAASSVKDTGEPRGADLAFDGLLQTSWAEGAASYGEGEWLEIQLDRPTKLDGISFWPGDLSHGSRSFRESSRPKVVTVLVDGKEQGEPLHLLDEVQRVDVPLHGITGRTIRLRFDEVYEGIVTSDLAIAEVAVNYPLGDQGARLDKWLQGREAQRLQGELDQAIEDAYARYKAAEYGDRDALAFLMDVAADGPEWLRPRVLQLVPPGYRAQAIRPVDKALVALRKLKDPNAIPAIELAALRETGERQAELRELVEIFSAYQELVSGGNRNVGYWGQPGWEPGALRGFDEPLAIEIDRYNNVYVADTANNRIQVFDENGKPIHQYGAPEPDISNTWFQVGRPWYVAGARPGEGPGEWTNPLDVELIPGKETDRWAALDALGRIQVYDADGHLLIGWKVETRKAPEPKLGGQAYLCWVPQREWLVAIIKNEAVAYTLDSEEVARWKVEDGTPNAAEVSRKGRLLLAFGDHIVRYDPDGFRYGTVIDDRILGEGWEDVDLTLDEEGRLWVVTDTGWVYKFKKPGKLDFKARAIDDPLFRQRIAVREGIVFYTNDDRIKQVDVLQYLADEAQRAEQEGETP